MDTRDIFAGILEVACGQNDLSSQLRRRINESYNRIVRYKTKNAVVLMQNPNIPSELIEEAIELYGYFELKKDNKDGTFSSWEGPLANRPFCIDDKRFEAFQAQVEELGLIEVTTKNSAPGTF